MRTRLWKACLLGSLVAVMIMPSAMAKAVNEGIKPVKAMEGKGWKHEGKMFETLGLTKEQKVALEENRGKDRAQFKVLRERMQLKRKELRTELEKPQLEMSKVTAVHNELKALMMAMEDQHLAAILEIRKVLTPEQFVKFQAMMPDKKGPRHGQMHGKDKKNEK